MDSGLHLGNGILIFLCFGLFGVHKLVNYTVINHTSLTGRCPYVDSALSGVQISGKVVSGTGLNCD